MARQYIINVIGRLGPTVHYKLGDTYVTRGLPRKYKQTKATKARANEFGKAVKAGATLRSMLLPAIPFPKDNKMQTRFATALAKWMRPGATGEVNAAENISFIDEFEFTDGYPLYERWNVLLEITNPSKGLIELKIPAFIPSSIHAPAHTVSVQCKIAAASCKYQTSDAQGQFFTSLNIPYIDVQQPEQIIQMNLPTPKGNVILMAMFLEYMVAKKGVVTQTTNSAFMPAGIIGAMSF
jgi:hypothetical protein